MAARLRAAAALLAATALLGGCLRAPEADRSADPLRDAQAVRGDVALYLADDDGAAGARTVPVLRPFPGQAPRVALRPMPAIARGQVARVALSVDEYQGPVLDLQLSQDGTRRLAEVTRENVGKRMAVVVDGRAVSVATIQGEIPGGRLRLSGLTQADAQALQRELTAAR